MTPEADDLRVTDASSASIESGMAPSVMKAWQTGGDLFGVIVPVDAPTARLPTIIDAGGSEHFVPVDAPTARLPTIIDAGGSEHFVPGGRTAVNIVGGFFVNETSECVVDGTVPMPLGPVVFKLFDGGHWEPVLVYGRTRESKESTCQTAWHLNVSLMLCGLPARAEPIQWASRALVAAQVLVPSGAALRDGRGEFQPVTCPVGEVFSVAVFSVLERASALGDLAPSVTTMSDLDFLSRVRPGSGIDVDAGHPDGSPVEPGVVEAMVAGAPSPGT